MDRNGKNIIILAGDIGGTKANLGLFQIEKNIPVLHRFETFSSRGASSLEEILAQFLKGERQRVRCCCLGVAGPVIEGKSQTTNLPWTLSEQAIKETFQFDVVVLLNDLVATALSLPILPHGDLFSLNSAQAVSGQSRVLIAPGTGLGMCLIPYVKNDYIPQASEGGHVNFAPRSEEEIRLFRYLQKMYGHVSYERLLSGPGIVNIYNWLLDDGFAEEPQWLSKQFKYGDQARIISENGMAANDKLCEKTLDIFVSLLGSMTANLALMGMATGGVYVGGGIIPKMLDKLKKGSFYQSFIDKGRYQKLLEKIPIHVILNDKAAMHGAAYYAAKQI